MSFKPAKQLNVLDGPEVYVGDGKKTIRVPLAQATPSASSMLSYSKALKQVPQDFFTTSGSAYTDVIPMKAFSVAKEVTLEISVEVRNQPVRLAPVNTWFNRIDIKQDSAILTSIYPDYLQASISLLDRHYLDRINKGLGVNKKLAPMRFINAGTKKNFYLPFVGTFFNNPIIWSNLKSDLTFDFYSAGNPIAEGAGTMVVTGMRFMVETENLSDRQDQVYAEVFKREIKAHTFIEGVTQSFPSIAMTPSVASEFTMSSLTSKQVAALLVAIRPQNASNLNNKRQSYVDLGPKASIDIRTAGGQSVFAGGNFITEEYLREHIIGAHLDNDWFVDKRLYIIPLCRDLKNSVYNGVRDGFLDLSSATDKVVLIPDAQAAPESHTLTLGTPLTAGTYRIGFRGEWSAWLAYDATAPQLTAAVEAMDVFKYAPGGSITVAVNNTAVSPTIIFSFQGMQASYPDNRDLIDLQTFQPTTVTTALTSPGRPGFVPGTYDVSITALKFKQFYAQDGILKTTDYV